MKICVISAIFSKNKISNDIPFVEKKIPNVDYLLFTNCKKLTKKYSGWKIILKNIEYNCPIYTARKYKWLTHTILNDEYDLMIWIDGYLSPDIKFNWNKIFEKYKSNKFNGMILKKHPGGKCIYKECYQCVKAKKIKNYKMKKLVNFLLRKKMPFNYGLYETGILIKPLKNNILNNFLNIFFYHMLKFSYRDQTLLTYVLWKYKYKKILLLNKFGKNYYIKSGKIKKIHKYI